MNSGVAGFLGLLGKVSGQASVLIVIILVLQWAFQRRLSPRARAALWLLVVVRLLLPISLSSYTSIFNLLPHPDSEPAPKMAIGAAELSSLPLSKTFGASEIEDSTLLETQTNIRRNFAKNSLREPYPQSAPILTAQAAGGPSLTKAAPTHLSWSKILFGLWFAGVLVLSLLVFISSFRLGRKVKQIPGVADPAILILFANCKRLTCSKLDI
jgi:bla regulator protein BlaR1